MVAFVVSRVSKKKPLVRQGEMLVRFAFISDAY